MNSEGVSLKEYMTPALSNELINYYCILPIHHWRYPITPYPPFLDAVCAIEQRELVQYTNQYGSIDIEEDIFQNK